MSPMLLAGMPTSELKGRRSCVEQLTLVKELWHLAQVGERRTQRAKYQLKRYRLW